MKRLRFIASACIALACIHGSAFAQPASDADNTATPPKLVQSAEPVYPESKRQTGEAASVDLVLTLDESGHVSEATISNSAGEEFDHAAIDAAKLLVFEPAMRGGKAVASRIPFHFEFALAPPPPAPEPPPAPPPPPSQKVEPAAAPAPAPAAADEGSLDIDVEGQRPPREPTQHSLSGEEIRKSPGTNGDAIRSIGNMPGVARTAAFDGLLIVRGSAPQDTQVFLDGTNIPLVYHFGGLSSVVPSEMLERIDFYPGNFGPQYGRATGGIIDVAVRSPRKDKIGGLVQVDTVDGRLLVEGPIDDKTRFMLGGRRSWLDVWLGPALKASGVGVSTAPVYYDYQALIERDVSRDTTVRLFAFGASDRLKLELRSPDSADPAIGGDFQNNESFWRVQGRVDTRPNSAVRWTTTASVGQNGASQTIGDNYFHLDTFTMEGRSDLRVKLAPAITAVAGLDVQRNAYDVSTRVPAINFDTGQSEGPLFGKPANTLSVQRAITQPAAYAMLELTPLPGLKLLPGVRFDYGQDTKQTTADPRLGVRYDVHPGYPRTTLKGGVGLFHQPAQPYETTAPFGNKGVGAESAIHYSAGFEQEILPPVELSVEGFYKDLRDLVERTPAIDESGSGVQYANIGSGRTYGAEFLLRYKPVGRFFGWVAYTLSRSERRDAPGKPLYSYDYDQTHNFTALASYKLGRGWQLGGRFRYVTGNPYTPKIDGVVDYDAGVYAGIDSPNKNSARLPSFQQLDLRIDKTWKHNNAAFTLYFDIQNVYNRQNVEALADNYNFSKTTATHGLPILPIIGFRGEL